MTADARLDQSSRAAALEALATKPLDVLVVGGGITGVGVALDAATRGLRVGLVERGDFASGTSSRSSKLIHGGLRYLQHRNFKLVREALHERRLLLTKLAPHLVRPVPFLLPLQNRRQRAYFGTGVALYDAMSGGARGVPRHRHLDRVATLRAAPAIREDAVAGAIRYFDAQMDDARFALTVLRTAVALGAHAASRAAVVGFLGSDRVDGVALEDVETGAQIEAQARVTIVAGGVWSGELETLANVPAPVSMSASKGVHILVPRDRLDLHEALILRTDRSVLLVVPWNGHWLIGTTDTAWTDSLDAVSATSDDVDYLLAQLNGVLRDQLSPSDVTAAFAGLRPLVDDGQRDTAEVSREHVVRRPKPGLVTVTGGKYTTYRVMASAAVDVAARELGTDVRKSRTEATPLLGAERLDETRRALRDRGMHVATRERLIGRYGSLALDVARLMDHDGGGTLLPGGGTYLRTEAAYAVTHEGALGLQDVLARRTRIAIETPDGGAAAAPEVAALLQRELGWSAQRTADEIAAYNGWLAAERAGTFGGSKNGC